MNNIKLVSKKTGKVDTYDIYLGNAPQTVMVENEGVARGYSSLAALAEDYEIAEQSNKG